MPQLSIAALGPIQITLDGAPPAFDYAKVRALLVYLAVEGRQHSRDALAELLWPEQEPGAGRNSLRRALAALRTSIADQAADPPLILADRETVRLNPRGDCRLDSGRFAALVEAVERHAHPPGRLCAACAAALEEAAALYRGPFGEGLLPRGCPELEAWAMARREWFEGKIIAALDALAQTYAAEGRYERALDRARAQIALDPLREPAHRQAMRALAAQGLRAAALTQYAQLRRLLADELGAEPEPETSALAEAIRAGELKIEHVELRNPAVVPPNAPSAAQFSTLNSQFSLPAPATALIGREQERRELAELLADPACRLLSLLGPGGIGKTRLALQLAEDAAYHFPDGVCWVALAALPSAEQLADALAQALGCAPKDGSDARAALRAYLQPRRLLLIADNLEHLSDGAPLIDELLAGAPLLKILATSRERLQLQREWLYDLGGLAFPAEQSAESAEAYPAVQLLLERSRQVRRAALTPAERQAACQIARAVEGMPLALELAAAASRERSFAAIAESLARTLDLLRSTLRDVPERHRSVRAAIDHSWQLLGPAEQQALARLSVFHGGFEPAGAARVASADSRLLAALQDKSLLRGADGRYDMHELLRQFAATRLAEAGEEMSGRAAHLGYLVELAELAEPQLTGSQQRDWLDRLGREHANFRAALRWAIDAGRLDAAARLAGAIWRFWWMRGHLREGRRWLDEILARAEEIAPAALARAARGAGSLANQQGDHLAARAHHSLALELERGLGNRRGVASQLGSLARVETNMGQHERARALLEEGMAIHRELGNQTGVALNMDALATLAHNQGDLEESARLYREALGIHKARGDRHSVAIGTHNLADIAYERGDLAAAEAGSRESLTLFRELGHTLGIGAALHLLAAVARSRGDLAGARAAELEALELYYGVGNGQIIAICLVGMAAIAAQGAGWERAARLCGAAQTVRGRAELPRPDQLLYEQVLAEARSALGDAGAEAAWAAGAGLDAEGALALARGR